MLKVTFVAFLLEHVLFLCTITLSRCPLRRSTLSSTKHT